MLGGYCAVNLCFLYQMHMALSQAMHFLRSSRDSDVGVENTALSIHWAAPELLVRSYKYLEAKSPIAQFPCRGPNCNTDVYSLAVVIWELATCEIPYGDLSVTKLMRRVADGQRLKIPEQVPSQLASVVDQGWSHDPHNRPSASELLAAVNAVHETRSDTWLELCVEETQGGTASNSTQPHPTEALCRS